MRSLDQSALAGTAPLVRWHRVLTRLVDGHAPEPDDAIWLAEACREMIEHGAPLREVFGLPNRGGAGGLPRVAMLARRDALLRALHATCYPELDAGPAAREITVLAARQQRSTRVPTDERERRVADLLNMGGIPRERTLRTILGRSKPI